MKKRLICGAAALLSSVAQADTRSYIDLQGGAGYSTNPLLLTDMDEDSGFGRISAYAFHGWSTPRSESSVSAYVENTSYLREYGNQEAFEVAARSRRNVSENLVVFGSANFRGDYSAQLGTRFFGPPREPVPVDVIAPDPVIVVDPDLFALNRRQYSVAGQLGLSTRLSERDALTTAVGLQRLFLSDDGGDLDFTQADASAEWSRTINERLTAGLRVILQRSDFSRGRSITSYGPQATAQLQLSENWELTGALGFVRVEQDGGELLGELNSIDLAADASLCRNVEQERLCARVARRTQSSILGGAPTTTSAGLDAYRRLSARDTVQASASLARSDGLRIGGVEQKSGFYSLTAGYDRVFGDRLSGGVNLSARRLVVSGPNPRADVGGSLYLRYRIGDLR